MMKKVGVGVVALILISVLSLSLASAFWPFDWIFGKKSVTGNVVADNPVDNTQLPNNAKCNDTDGGVFSKIAAKVRTKTLSLFGRAKYTERFDRCVSNTKLIEYYCNKNGKAQSQQMNCENGCKGGACKPKEEQIILAIVDNKFYSRIPEELRQWESDLGKDNIKMKLVILDQNNNKPEMIRNAIKSEYAINPKLRYAVLIGDISIPYQNVITVLSPSGIASDKFYGDMNTNYEITTGPVQDRFYFSLPDGYRQVATEGNEVMIGRLLPPTGYLFEERVTMLKNYFTKNHRFRAGELTYQKKMFSLNAMEILDGKQLEAEKLRIAENNKLYPTVSQIVVPREDDMKILMMDFVENLNYPYEIVVANIHGGADGINTEYLNGKFGRFDSSEIKNIYSRPAVFIFKACSVGDLSHNHYLAGEFLFNGDTLAVIAAPIPFLDFQTYIPSFNLVTYDFLSNGGTIGNILNMNDLSFIFFGDPTIRLRPEKQMSGLIEVTPSVVDVGALEYGKTVTRDITLYNSGGLPINILEIGGKDEILNYFPSFTEPISFPDYKQYFNIEPKQKYTFQVIFKNDKDTENLRGNTFYIKRWFATDNPQQPTFYIDFKGLLK